MKIEDLKPDPMNANRGTPRGRKLVEKSLESYGAGRSILVDSKGVIIAGNKTIEGAKKVGKKKLRVVQTTGDEIVVVQRTDLDLSTDKKARMLAIADNRTAELGLAWDDEKLRGLDLSEFWNKTELRKLLGTPPDDVPAAKIDQAALLQKKWKTKRGQLWEIEKHRLMCGDSTEKEDVRALMQNSTARMMATDPPYGVGYGVESGPDSAKRFSAMQADEDNGPKLQEFLERVFLNALPYLSPGAVWYLWHAQMTQGFFAAAAAAAAAQFRIHRQIIWVKSHFILGHGDFHWQHELCFYGWRKGEKHLWYGGRDQSTLWNIPNSPAHKFHPAEKPPEIFSRAMQLSTAEGDICYEPFSGTGAQFCAAQKNNRICYGMEIEPKYVAVALQRLADIGLKPKLIDDGKGKR